MPSVILQDSSSTTEKMAWNQHSPPRLGIAQLYSISETIFQSAEQHLRVVSKTIINHPLKLNS